MYIIYPDETGFIRMSTNNLYRLVHLIDCYPSKLKSPLISLDVENAFDRVTWKFVLATLHTFGFGNSSIDWIQIVA